MGCTSSSSAVSSVPLIQPSSCNKKRMKNSFIASKALFLQLLVEEGLVCIFPFKFQVTAENFSVFCLVLERPTARIWHKMCQCEFVSRDRDQILHTFTRVSTFVSDLRQTGCHLSDLDDPATEKVLLLLAVLALRKNPKYKSYKAHGKCVAHKQPKVVSISFCFIDFYYLSLVRWVGTLYSLSLLMASSQSFSQKWSKFGNLLHFSLFITKATALKVTQTALKAAAAGLNLLLPFSAHAKTRLLLPVRAGWCLQGFSWQVGSCFQALALPVPTFC